MLPPPTIASAPALPQLAPAVGANSRRRADPWGWGGLGVACLVGLVAGVGGALLFAGLFAFVVAIVALIRGNVRWAHLPSRAAGTVALVGALVVVFVGAAVSPSPSTAQSGDATAPVTTSAPPPAPTSGSTPPSSVASPAATADTATTAISQARPGTALAVVGTLAVKGRGPLTGYARAAFGSAWTDVDHNGCDQRNDTLRRDLSHVTLKAGTSGCVVVTGTLTDPYTGTSVSVASTASASAVQIDHVVPLADAWVKGASGWPQEKRTAFANDALDLLAVSAKANASKGAGDAATWLPPAKGYRCTYVARQVAVKARYQLTVTAAERAAMVRVLAACPDTPAPSISVAALGGFPLYVAPHLESTPKPFVKPAPKPVVKPAPRPVVKPAPRPVVKPAPRPVVKPAPRPVVKPAPRPVVKPAPRPVMKPAPRPVMKPAPRPVMKPAPKPAAPAPLQGVHPGSFCSNEGALGHTNRGTLMRCSTKPGDPRARWRAA